jgi:hypothetical protein
MFESNLTKLMTVKADLETTIDLHNRYKDAVSIKIRPHVPLAPLLTVRFHANYVAKTMTDKL